jgi:hypothetical protein
MLIKHKKPFVRGLVMAFVFAGVLAVMFMPIFNGGNAFHASDKLFNSISKGSTYYIPMLRENAKLHMDAEFDGLLELDGDRLGDAAKLLTTAGAEAKRDGESLRVRATMGTLYEAVLRDSDDMFENRGRVVSERYGIREKRVLFTWWTIMKAMAKVMDTEKRFAESKYVGELLSRGVEVGYNYYKIAPEKAAERWAILTGALVFYVLYTLWWGFAVYFLFEGVGLQLTAGHKKES